MLSYWYKVNTQQAPDKPGVTSELSGLITYLVGSLVFHDYFWIATTLTVASLLLLELKDALEGLTRRIDAHEILTFTKFLLLTVVILPVLPNQDFGRFLINPFKTWLVVVAVSTVSYGSYLLLQVTKESGILLSAILGGIYSSTATTVALAKRSSREDSHPHLFAGAILLASAFMYLRITILVGIFNWKLLHLLAGPFLTLAVAAAVTGFFWSRRPDGPREKLSAPVQARKSAGTPFRIPFCRPFSRDPYPHETGLFLYGEQRGLHSRSNYRVRGCGSVYFEHDAIGRGDDFACCKRRRYTS